MGDSFMRKYDKHVTKKVKICFGQSGLINQRNDYLMNDDVRLKEV